LKIKIDEVKDKMEFSLEINELHHVITVRKQAADMAEEIGFSQKNIEEISIVVSELADNLIKHKTINGKIICSLLKDGDRKGIQIISEDCGPGIKDTGKVLKDGYSEKSGLGIGLGAVKRLMDEFDIHSKTERSGYSSYEETKEGIGTIILARKWIVPKELPGRAKLNETRFGIMSRPRQGEKYNGDQFFLKYFDGKAMISVIDGIGHGEKAHEAAKEAYLCLLDNYRKSLDLIIDDMHQRLRRTRGAAVSIALIDEHIGTLDYVGIGNVVTRVLKSTPRVSPANYNGIVGVSIRKFKVFRYPWEKGNLIIMSSDGISEKYDLDKYPGLTNKHPMVIADVILRDYGRQHDDATVIAGGLV